MILDLKRSEGTFSQGKMPPLSKTGKYFLETLANVRLTPGIQYLENIFCQDKKSSNYKNLYLAMFLGTQVKGNVSLKK